MAVETASRSDVVRPPNEAVRVIVVIVVGDIVTSDDSAHRLSRAVSRGAAAAALRLRRRRLSLARRPARNRCPRGRAGDVGGPTATGEGVVRITGGS